MEIERKSLTLTVDANFAPTLKALEAEGWEIDPTQLPTATYHMVREVKRAPTPGGIGELVIDESQIVILRKDGSLG